MEGEEETWAFLAPSWRVLQEHGLWLPVQRDVRRLTSEFCGISVVARNTSSQLRDALELVALQWVVDASAFKRFALAHCVRSDELADASISTLPASDSYTMPLCVQVSFVDRVRNQSLIYAPNLLSPVIDTLLFTRVPLEERRSTFRQAYERLMQIISNDPVMSDTLTQLHVDVTIDIWGIDMLAAVVQEAQRCQQLTVPVSIFQWSQITLTTNHFFSIVLTAPPDSKSFSWVTEDAFCAFVASSRWRELVSKQCAALQHSTCVQCIGVSCYGSRFSRQSPLPQQMIQWLADVMLSSSTAHDRTQLSLFAFAITQETLEVIRRRVASDHSSMRVGNDSDAPASHNRRHWITSLEVAAQNDGMDDPLLQSRRLLELLELVGAPLEELTLHDFLADSLLMETIGTACSLLTTLQLSSGALPAARRVIDLYERELWRMPGLELTHPHGSSVQEFTSLIEALLTPSLRITHHVRELSLRLDREYTEIDSSVETLIVRLLETNRTLEFVHLKLPRPLYARLAPVFLALDCAWVPGLHVPVPFRSKCAFLSVVAAIDAASPITRLDEDLMTTILTFAAKPVKRRLLLATYRNER